MAGEDLSENLLRFLDDYVDSVEQVRVLLLLHSSPQKTWEVAELTKILDSADPSITKRLDDLYARRVLRKPAGPALGHQYVPFSDEIDNCIKELATQNRLKPYSVIEAIYSRPQKSLKAFADAFKLRGDGK